MTAGIRRWTRRRKPNDLSLRLAAIRRHRSAHMGTIETHLLGEDRFRKVVAVALLLRKSVALAEFRKFEINDQTKRAGTR
jgi:hypothetical protein